MSERGGGFGSFLLGIAVGAVVGMLFAPEAGEGTRRKLSRRLRDLKELADEKADDVRQLLEAGDEEEGGEGEDDDGDEPRSTREELERRLAAARRRRQGRGGGGGTAKPVDEEDEPVA